jgi:RHS repeat-associated protein
MNIHPITTPASPSLASPLTDAAFDSIESLTTTFTSPVVPTLETTTVTEVALGYHRNQQYSITAMTTSTGAVAERYAYTAYGQPTILNASGIVLTSSAFGNRYSYTGREWDETLGLHHFRARWMSPLAGRFLGRDPIGYQSMDVNLSRFVMNQALKRLDPMGWECTVHVMIGHGPRGYIDEYKELIDFLLRQGNPEFDKCDLLAPVCCWVKDGKEVCKDRIVAVVFPADWPDHNLVIDTKTKEGKKLLRELLVQELKNALRQCCRKDKRTTKCDCQGVCRAQFYCQRDLPGFPSMKEVIDPIVSEAEGDIPANPCKQDAEGKTPIWEWDCKTNSYKSFDSALKNETK